MREEGVPFTNNLAAMHKQKANRLEYLLTILALQTIQPCLAGGVESLPNF